MVDAAPGEPDPSTGTGGPPVPESSLIDSGHWFDTLVRNTSDLIAVLDARGHLVYANPAAERLLGYSLADQAGLDMFDLVHPDDVGRAAEAFVDDVTRPGTHPRAAYRFRTSTGEWRVLELVATNCLDDPVVGGIVVNARDVTERTNLTRALSTLSQSSQILVRATDEQALLLDTCRMAVESGGYALAWVGYPQGDEARTVRVAASWGATDYLDGIVVSWGDDEAGWGPVGQSIRSGAVQVVADIAKATTFAPWRSRAERSGLRSVCALPLGRSGQSLGSLAIYAADAGAFTDEAVTLLRGLADNLAYGISRIRDGRALEASETRFRTLAGAAPIGIIEATTGGTIEYVNLRAAEIAGRSVDSLKARGWMDAVHPDDVPELLSLVEHPRLDRRIVTTRFRVRRPDGELRHVRLSGALKGDSVAAGYVAAIEDISEEVRAQQSLLHQAFYDTLTGLPNRALFLDRLNQELAPARGQETRIAVLFLDVDRLKLVNDSLGHEVGDAVLCEVARRLEQGIRSGETVARFSGDEFVFILRDVRRPDDAVSVAVRILANLQSPFRHAGRDLYMTASIGIVLPEGGADPRTVVRDADTAMYQAKWAGGNGYALFDEELHHRSIARLTVESELREALLQDQFELFYQPILDPSSERPVGAEALIRWHHPRRGLVLPAAFIPVAEESDLIKPIGRWVFEQSIAQLAAWDAAVDAPALEVLAINLSARQLGDDESFESARQVLERHPGMASRIGLEVTETSLMAEGNGTRGALDRLRRLGLHFAIDDFGTGYSSLSYLHSLPVDTVKIDQSFVERLGTPEDSAPIVRAIIQMAHAMGMRVVAEGVFDGRRLELVSAMGCDLGQGFYWTPPLPAGEFAEWWAAAVRRAESRRGRPGA